MNIIIETPNNYRDIKQNWNITILKGFTPLISTKLHEVEWIPQPLFIRYTTLRLWGGQLLWGAKLRSLRKSSTPWMRSIQILRVCLNGIQTRYLHSAIHIPLTPIISMAWITLNHTLEKIWGRLLEVDIIQITFIMWNLHLKWFSDNRP